MAQREIIVRPTRPGTPQDPTDWAAWRDLDLAITPDGGGTYGYSQLNPPAAGNTGRFLLEAPIPTSATIDELHLHVVGAAELDASQSLGARIFGFVLEDGTAVTAQSSQVTFESSDFEEASTVITGAPLDYVRDHPGLLRRVGLVLASARSDASTTERLLIDSFFLRVLYTYEPEELAATFEATPGLSAALRLAGYLSADFETQTELAAMLAPVVRELSARFEVTAQLDADLRRAALLEVIVQVAPHLEADVRKVLDIPHGPQLRIAPVGARLVLMAHAIKQGDTAEPLAGQCLDVHGEPIDLTDRTVTVIVSPRPGAEPIVERQATVTDAAQGRWRLDWRAGDTDRPGTYRVDVELVDVNGDRQTVPGSGHGIITIGRGLA